MDIPSVSKITKVISVDNTPTEWEKARMKAKEQNIVPEFHWEHKNTMYDNIRDALGYSAIWRIDSVTHFNEIAFYGYIKTLHYSYYKTGVITIAMDKADPTWFDIYKACNEAIVYSQRYDNHHLYIEIVNRTEDRLYLFTGS